MKHSALAVIAAMCCAFSGATLAMDKAEHKSQKDKISADYKAAKSSCTPLKDNAKDICEVEAKGNYKVANATLEAQFKPSPSHDRKVMEEKAEAAYELAKEKCDDMKGEAKDSCKKEAKAAQASAKAQAKATKG